MTCERSRIPDYEKMMEDSETSEQMGTDGVALIATERQRQIDEENWEADHDDAHRKGELALAAVCYAMRDENRGQRFLDQFWPFDPWWWKPSPANRVRELVKAGALIAAEIDRIQRLDRADSVVLHVPLSWVRDQVNDWDAFCRDAGLNPFCFKEGTVRAGETVGVREWVLRKHGILADKAQRQG